MTITNFATYTQGAVGTASQQYSLFVYSRALDEDDDTYWRTVNAMTGQWYRVALFAPVSVSQFGMWLKGDTLSLPQTYRVEYSDDDANWQTLGEYARTSNPHLVTLQVPVTARYWKFTCLTGGNYAFCCTQFYLNADSEAVFPGWEYPTPPECAEISAWLDHLETNYVPCVEAWLAEQEA